MPYQMRHRLRLQTVGRVCLQITKMSSGRIPAFSHESSPFFAC